MWNLVLCGISGILLGFLFSLERSSPIRSKFDYDEQVLERVIRNDILLKDALEKITETKVKVEQTLAKIIEEHANAEVKLKDVIHTLEVKRTDLDNKIEAFINSATRNVSVTVEEMKAYLKSLVSQTDNELKAKTRHIDEKVDEFIDSSSQKVHQTITDMTSAARLLVERTASELDIIKAQRVVPLVNFDASYITEDDTKKVVFKTVMANDGGGYDSKTGIFTAPISGVYIFTVQYCPVDKSLAGLAIVKEGKPLQTSAFSSLGDKEDCVDMQVVAKVPKGAKVWVREPSSAIYYVYQDDTHLNSFSGLLIHAIEN